jgi:hypothetical protein
MVRAITSLTARETKSRLQPDMKNLLLLCLVFTGSCYAQDTAVNSATHDHASAAEWFEKNTVTVNKAAGNFSGLLYDYTLTSAPGTDNRLIDFTVDSTSVFRVNEDGQLTLVNGVMTGQSLTGSQNTSLLDMTSTWNTTGTPTALKLNVTDTASNASSLLMDLQVGGSSKFEVDKFGALILGPAITTDWVSAGVRIGNRYGLPTIQNGTALLNLGTSGEVNVGGSEASYQFSGVTKLYSDTAGILAQRNGTNAQESRIYNTYTNSSNYERLEIGFKDSLNVATIKTTRNGTGTVRNLSLQPNDGNVGIGDPTPSYKLDVAGDASFGDNANGIAIRFHDIHGGSVNAGIGSFSSNTAVKELAFYVASTTENEAMRINYLGNVGIGTTSPGSKLDVAGGVTLRDRGAMTLTAAQSKIWSQSGEMKVIDAAGNITTISPHPQELMDVLGVTGAAKTLGMDYTTPESGLAVAQPKARWLEWYVEIDHATGSWTKRNFNGNEIESGQSNTLVKIK